MELVKVPGPVGQVKEHVPGEAAANRFSGWVLVGLARTTESKREKARAKTRANRIVEEEEAEDRREGERR